jgi:hypothetical protein
MNAESLAKEALLLVWTSQVLPSFGMSTLGYNLAFSLVWLPLRQPRQLPQSKSFCHCWNVDGFRGGCVPRPPASCLGNIFVPKLCLCSGSADSNEIITALNHISNRLNSFVVYSCIFFVHYVHFLFQKVCHGWTCIFWQTEYI